MVRNVARLFDIVGKDEQVLKWIREFSSNDRTFAVLKVSGASLNKYCSEISDDIAVLSKLDLIPPVVYGWGDALTQRLRKHGIDTKIDSQSGVRITKKEDLGHLEAIAEEHFRLLEMGLRERGVPSEYVKGVFEATKKNLVDCPGKHFTGDVKSVDTKMILNSMLRGFVPIIPPLGYTNTGQLMNINGDTAARALTLALKPQRYIMLTNTGGVLDNDGNIISEINLSGNYDALVESGVIEGGMKVKVDEARETITGASNGYSLDIQIANPKHILTELFTDSGRGTIIRQ